MHKPLICGLAAYACVWPRAETEQISAALRTTRLGKDSILHIIAIHTVPEKKTYSIP